MGQEQTLKIVKKVLEIMPTDWLCLTTHRLDIYEEEFAKIQFLEKFEEIVAEGVVGAEALHNLPTAYDYIRLGHPLSCILEWATSKFNALPANNIICFSSRVTPILAILRKNLLDKVNTQINYIGTLPSYFRPDIIREVYGYSFELKQINNLDEIEKFDGKTIFIDQSQQLSKARLSPDIDFSLTIHDLLGSILFINNSQDEESYIKAIQHVRRRETIAMTPADCFTALRTFLDQSNAVVEDEGLVANKQLVLKTIQEVNGTSTKALVGSSGLSIQYAIMMGLVDDALQNHPGKAIKFIVPPNCYGGTNDQARRVAACIPNVEIVDLPVDGDNDMVQSIHTVLGEVAQQNAVPYIIAEIPTNPRVEVPDLHKLREALSADRFTTTGAKAIDPVFILDQTFCPNVHFLGEGKMLSSVRTISYASGSKFPSGGLCTAGYCIGNKLVDSLMDKVEAHLHVCDNEATQLQYEILAKQMPSMTRRIQDAYLNTREFVNFISETLPEAKINFVSEELAEQGFTPSVFSLDLPTSGETEGEKEQNKRALNHKLIDMMITNIPDESKYCVSYGQLKGCYWTIPATSTQGTTKEGDKDYIARVSVSPKLDLALHKKVFVEFVNGM